MPEPFEIPPIGDLEHVLGSNGHTLTRLGIRQMGIAALSEIYDPETVVAFMT